MTKIIECKNPDYLLEHPELEGIKLIDMHCHSSVSDAGMHLSEIISKAHELKIGVCITDHNEIKASLLAAKEILSFPSTELTSSDCHDILAYFNDQKDANEFFHKNVKNNKLPEKLINLWKLKLSTAEIIEKLSDYNAVIVIPHPFVSWPKHSQKYFEKPENKKLLNKIDAIEGINGCLVSWRNNRAIKWAAEINKPITGGSDAHDIHFVGNVLTGCFAETRTEFLEEIKAGKNYVIVRKKIGFFEKTLHGGSLISRNINFLKRGKKEDGI
jgi:predicted metal-dependent phosphoesterase TrpH